MRSCFTLGVAIGILIIVIIAVAGYSQPKIGTFSEDFENFGGWIGDANVPAKKCGLL